MFGLILSSTLDASKSNSVRRSVFYENLTGAFPLMGLLSLVDVEEELDKQEIYWNEEREIDLRSLTVAANSAGPFTTQSGAAGAAGVDKTSAGWTATSGDAIRVAVADASVFRERDVVQFQNLHGTASSLKDLRGIVTAVWTVPNTIDITVMETMANLLNDSTNVGFYASVIGSAAIEGSYSKKGGMTFPITPGNFTQIFKTPVGPFSRNALKMGLLFDKTGAYRTAARSAHIRHMKVMEWPLYFGRKTELTEVDPADNETKRTRTFAGIVQFLEWWEKGTVANGSPVAYRPGGSDISASDWRTEPLKRIIKLAGGTITFDEFQLLHKMMFDYTGDNSFEKLGICGNGFLMVFNALAEKLSIRVTQVNTKEQTFGMEMFSYQTVNGTIFFKTHPLFNRHPDHAYSCIITDLGSLAYHPFQDSDTELIPNIQLPDFDGRKDQWLTEFGFEVRFPERHMYIQNLRGITV